MTSLILLSQGPGGGWAMVDAPPREVRRLYWELQETTEVWVRLTPGDPNGAAPLISLVFQAFFPGRAARDPYTGLPQWPKGEPARLVVRAEPFPLTAIRGLSLQLVLDGHAFNLAGPGSRYAILPCGVGSDDCAPNSVEAELDPALLRALTVARTVGGEALGFPITLAPSDQRALAEFAARVSVTTATNPDRTDKRQPLAPTSGSASHRQLIRPRTDYR
jgi:hypothetical protein